MKRIILILLFLLIGVKLFPAALFDPQLEWKSIKTEHFWIHYHQGIEEQALDNLDLPEVFKMNADITIRARQVNTLPNPTS